MLVISSLNLVNIGGQSVGFTKILLVFCSSLLSHSLTIAIYTRTYNCIHIFVTLFIFVILTEDNCVN